MLRIVRVFWLSLILSVALGACGLSVPEKDLFSNNNVAMGTPSPQGLYENTIVGHIRCELREGVRKSLAFPEVQWLRGWGATVTLKLTVEESGGLSPGVSVLQPLRGSQTFTLGVGASGTAKATRLETITFTLDFDELLRETPTPCEGLQGGVMIEGDLKIAQFIYDKAVVSAVGEATTKNVNTPPFSTFQEDITFVASLSANATPTWKLVRVTIDPGSPLVNASRTRTHDVLITLAAVAKKATRKSQAELTQTGREHHTAGLIGGATASQIQSQAR
jgi:hypothetical protein